MILTEHLGHDGRGLPTEKSTLNENHQRHGLCQFFTHGRLSMEITYEHGLRHGITTLYHGNGKIHSTMTYVKDYLEGERKSFDEHGVLTLLETYRNGQLHGPYKSYHPNGELHQEGTFEDHLKSGVWETYDRNKKLLTSEHFDKGIRMHHGDEDD